MTIPEIAQITREQIPALTGFNIDTISHLGHDDNGWHATVELVELKRIPNSSDVLATYDVRFDESGNITGYERTKRYQRSQLTA
jgi:hypothetical protein